MRIFDRLREPVNGITHLAASVFALGGWVILVVLGWGDTLKLVVASVFGLSLTTLFLASGLYHSVVASPLVVQRLRKFDHAAIFLLIAGTYTPITALYLGNAWRWGLLAVVWIIAAAGIIFKLFVIDAPRWLSTGAYLAMGWMAVFAVPELLKSMPPEVVLWMALGGALYTVGAGVYLLEKPNFKPGVFGYHELWHVFVILAGASHFLGIAYALNESSGLF